MLPPHPAPTPLCQIQDIVSKQPRVFARLSQLEDLRRAMVDSLTQYRRTTVVDHRVQASERCLYRHPRFDQWAWDSR